MKKLFFSLFLLLFVSITVNAQNISKNFEWILPTNNVDGSPLTDLMGVKIYYGFASRTYTLNTNILCGAIGSNCPVNGTVKKLLEGKTYYFAAACYNSITNESDYSNEIVLTIPDVTAPVISGTTINFTYQATPSLKGYRLPNMSTYFTITDNCTPSGSILITQSPVANTILPPGQYSVSLMATDTSGNKTTKMLAVKVLKWKPKEVVNFVSP